MIHFLSTFLARSGIIWVAILIGTMLAAVFVDAADQVSTDEGPFGSFHAFLVVNALHALVLAAISIRSILDGWKLGALLGATLFLAQSFLLLIEAIYFAGSVNAPLGQLSASGVIGLTSAICVGLITAVCWRRPRMDGAFDVSLAKLVLPVCAVSLLYIISYFTAGYFIAWAVPDVRTYYGEGLEIELAPLVVFQMFRGLIWALLALAIVRGMAPGRVVTPVIVGATFAILAAAQLLYPNSFMPWDVRLPHLVEVGISNFLFGAAAAIILQKRT